MSLLDFVRPLRLLNRSLWDRETQPNATSWHLDGKKRVLRVRLAGRDASASAEERQLFSTLAEQLGVAVSVHAEVSFQHQIILKAQPGTSAENLLRLGLAIDQHLTLAQEQCDAAAQ